MIEARCERFGLKIRPGVEFEVVDPELYTQNWKGQMSLNAVNGMYEYACHEGNYAMPGILEAGRKADREGTSASRDGDDEE